MRLFIAVPIPEKLKEHLKLLQSKLPKFVNVNKHIHLTLKFLGEVQPEKAEKIKEALNQIKFDSFEFRLGKIGFFPSEDYIRVVWLGIEPEEKLIELQKKIDESLKNLFPVEKDFRPHLTLARVKSLKNKDEFLKLLSGFEISKEIVKANEFSLIQSILGKENEYKTLLSIPAVK